MVDVTASAIDGAINTAGEEGEHTHAPELSVQYEGEHRRAENEHRVETAPLASPNTVAKRTLSVNQRLSL